MPKFNFIGKKPKLAKSKAKDHKAPMKLKVTVDKGFDPRAVARLSSQFMDRYHLEDPAKTVDLISPLEFLMPMKVSMQDQGEIMSLKISPDGKLLASFCKLGHVKLWDLDTFKHLATLRDREEVDIDEFYVGVFSPEQKHLLVGGKRKDRRHWSINDNDNRILPCTIKVFDTLTGRVVLRLEAHSEEVLCIKRLYFRGVLYYISCGQDGCIWKWRLSEDHLRIVSRSKMADGSTNIAFNIAFLPNVGNKYFIAACDTSLKIYDFELEKVVQTFETSYTSYCDNIKFVCPHADIRELWDSLEDLSCDGESEYLVSRGVEEIDEDGHLMSRGSNVLTLYRLIYPSTVGGKFKLTEVRQFFDRKYHANSWCINIACNQRYLVAPTVTGTLFFFCLKSGQVLSTYKEHQDVEIRDVVFHPSRKLLFSCGDDGKIAAYTTEKPEEYGTNPNEISDGASPIEDV